MKTRIQTSVDFAESLSTSNMNAANIGPHNANFKLPPLSIPTFDGDIKHWRAFWDRFVQCVEKNASIADDVVRLAYLENALMGKAKDTLNGLSSESKSYSEAVKMLKTKYDDPNTLVSVYYGELDDLPVASDGKLQRANLEAINKILHNISSLDIAIEQDYLKSRVLRKFSKRTVIAVLSKLDDDDNESPESSTPFNGCSLSKILSTLNKVIRTEERAEAILHSSDVESSFVRRKPPPLAAALMAPAPSAQSCIFCGLKNHKAASCRKFKTLKTRREHLKKRNLCFTCLSSHGGKCSKAVKCSLCKKSGHLSHMCVENLIKLFPIKEDTKPRGTFLETFTCRLPKYNNLPVRGVIDSGSQYSYLDQNLVKKLGLPILKRKKLDLCLFGSTEPLSLDSGEVRLSLGSLNNPAERTFSFMITPCITGDMVTSPSSCIAESVLPKNLDYADPDIFSEDKSPIQIVIGNNQQFDVFSGEIKRISSGITLRKSLLGWIPTGEIKSTKESKLIPALTAALSSSSLSSSPSPSFEKNESITKLRNLPDCNLDLHLEKLWSLESLGIKSSETQITDDIVLEKFRETVRFENDRYVVRWPWKQENPQLPTNYRMCLARLRSLLDRSDKDTLSKYNTLLGEQLSMGIIELAPKNTPFLTHYLPHRGILQRDKLRIVYDASAKTSNGHSLNDLLHRGPVFLENLVGLLINFRLYPVALTADIEKAFLQVSLNEVDRDCVRFLWVKDPNLPFDKSSLIVYRFARVPFGVISSPFLLNIVLQEHLSNASCNEWHLMSKEHFYVDNLVISVSNTVSAVNLYISLKEKMSQASFNLRDWTSNDRRFLKTCNLPPLSCDDPMISILGLNWDRFHDSLHIKMQTIDPPLHITKRIALQFYASIYDPLGLLSPCTLKLKLFIQECWKDKYEWDTLLPTDFIAKWVKIAKECLEIPKVKIPRLFWKGISDDTTISLHIFCDASKNAFACCAYLSFINEKTCTQSSALIYTKVRATPVNKNNREALMSIPRLELMAVLIGKRSATFLANQLKRPLIKTVLWTDATTVLQWLNSKSILPVFVQNRINEIKAKSDLSIRYVPTDQNPADIATRGASPSSLETNDLWWHGPPWLNHESLWPSCPPTTHSHHTPSLNAALLTGEISYSGILNDELENKFDSWERYIRIFTYCNRFKLRKDAKRLSLVEEYRQAERTLILEIQKKYFGKELKMLKSSKVMQPNPHLELFIDSDDFIRCKGRLQNVSFPWETIHPILLPKKSRLTRLYIKHLHEENHHIGVSHLLAKIRERFWIVKGRSLVKSVITYCVSCRRWEGGSYQLPPIPPLPIQRVHQAKPFTYTGIDYLGPLVLTERDSSVTCYVALFVCLVTRAVHLEVARNISADEFLMCLQRFVSRRGSPKFILSDNATNFTFVQPLVSNLMKQCNSQENPVSSYLERFEIPNQNLKKFLSSRGIHWKFIPPLAPWHGGAYERLVALVKRSLKKSHGLDHLDYVQFNTVLCMVENTINSRPLTYVSSDEVLRPLTPNHFLRPCEITSNQQLEIPNQPLPSTTENLIKASRTCSNVLESFWDNFRSLYLASLREKHAATHRPKKGSVTFLPKIGEIVLIREATAPRADWKVGKITHLDKRQAVAHVVSGGKTLIRAINFLHPLEIPSPTLNEKSSEPEEKRSKPSGNDHTYAYPM